MPPCVSLIAEAFLHGSIGNATLAAMELEKRMTALQGELHSCNFASLQVCGLDSVLVSVG